MTHTVAILDDIHLLPEDCEALRKLVDTPVTFPDDGQQNLAILTSRTHDADAVLVSPSVVIDEAYLLANPTVKYIGVCGTSIANLDLKALAVHRVRYTNVVDYGDEPTAEFIFMQLVTLARGMGTYQWKEMPCELMGKRMVIIGLGALGKAIAHLAVAYKMEVSYFSTHRKPEWEEQGLVYGAIDTLLPTADIVVVSTPTHVQVLGGVMSSDYCGQTLS